MALKWGDRAKETAANPAAGNVTLGGAAQGGFLRFSAYLANNDTCYYTMIDNLGAFEVGLGTWATGNIFSRNTILASSNSGSIVTFANPVVIWIDAPAGKSLQLDSSGKLVGSNAATVDLTNGINLPVNNAIGILPAANGGAGATSGIMKANGSGLVSGAVAGTDFAPPTIVSGSGPSGSGLPGQLWCQI